MGNFFINLSKTKMDAQYELKNSENQGRSVGTIKEPHFYDISSGQLDKKSLLFYAQIEQAYFMYHIKTVNRRTLNLKCKDRSCPAKAHAYISPESGLIFENGTRTNGRRVRSCARPSYLDSDLLFLYEIPPRG